MTLAALIKKGGLKEIATANFAKAANPEQQEQGTLAGLATLALAESSKPEAVPEWKPASVVEFGRDEAEREAFEERAGIREFDSGLSRREAEIEARRQRCLPCCKTILAYATRSLATPALQTIGAFTSRIGNLWKSSVHRAEASARCWKTTQRL